MRTRVRWRPFAQIVALSALVGAAGCEDTDWTRNIEWAPNGRYAAVIGPAREDGLESRLFLADTAGRLTSLHEPDVYRLAWFPDSERVVVARSRQIATFAELARALGPERTRILEQEGEVAWQMLHWAELPKEIDPNLLRDSNGIGLYLHDRHGDDIPERYQADPGQDVGTVPLHTLRVGRIVDGRLVLAETVYEGFTEVQSIRPAPDGRLLAFATKGDDFVEDSVRRLYVVPADGSEAPELVSASTNDFPDWSSDGRSLVFLRAAGSDRSIGSFGCLVTIDVRDSHRETCLVHAVFSQDARVRSLNDGRVLFDAFDISFPRAARSSAGTDGGNNSPDVPSRNLAIFSVNPSDATTAPTPLLAPASQSDPIVFYDVSPDRTRMVFGSTAGDIRLLTFSDGRIERLPLGDHNDAGPRAVWSGPAAVTYLTHVGSRYEYALWQGTSAIVLSGDWPADLLGSP